MDYGIAENETRINGEQTETPGDFRVIFESHGTLRGAPRLVWVRARQRYYIRWNEGHKTRTMATGTGVVEEAEAAFAFFKRDPEGFAQRPMRWTQPMPERAAKIGVVYFVGCKEVRRVKIGFAEDIGKRMKSLQCGSPVELRLLATVPGGLSDERAYHDRFYRRRLHGEWFQVNDEIEAEIERLKSGRL